MGSVSRIRKKPQFVLNFWRTDGKFFYADPAEFQDAVDFSGQTVEEIKSLLGPSRVYLQTLLQGGKIGLQSALLIEWALIPREMRLRSVV